MTTFTPLFSLPYPDALDGPCDFAQDWCAFTAATQGVLDRFQATIDRTVPAIPMARMTLSTPLTTVSGSLITFDAVSVNTAGWVDFDADPSGITVDRGGRFILVGNAAVASTGVANQLTLATSGGFNGASDTQKDRAAGNYCLNVSCIFTVSTVTTFGLTVSRGSVPTGNVTISAACISLWWHADGAAP